MEAYLQFDQYHIKITGNQDDNCTDDSMVFKASQQLHAYLLGRRKTF